MKSIFKIFAWIIGLALILILAVGVAVFSTDPNEHKEWLIAQAQSSLGRTVSIDGELDFTVYPWLGIEVNDLTVGNAQGFNETDFFHADYMHFRVRLMPLLNELYEIDTVKIHGAELNLAVGNDGDNNWQDLVAPTNDAESSTRLPLAAIILGGVDIQDANISWHDMVAEKQYQISNLNLSVGDLIYGAPIEINMGMDLDSSMPLLTGNANLNGIVAYDMDNESIRIEPLRLMSRLQGETVPGNQTELNITTQILMDLAADTIAINALSFETLDTRISGNIHVDEATSSTPFIESDLQLEGRDLAYWFKLLDVEPLASQLAALQDRQFALMMSLQTDVARGNFDVSGLNANLLGARIEGELSSTNVRSRQPGVKGNLSASGPDLPTLLQVIGQFEGGEGPGLKSYGQKLAAIPEGQKDFSLNLSFDADMRSGNVEVPVIAFDGVGISIEGELDAEEFVDNTGEISSSLRVTGTDINRWLDLAELETISAVHDNTLEKQFSFQSRFTADLSEGDFNAPQIAVNLLGADLEGSFTAKDIQTANRAITGTITATGPDLPALLQVAGQLSGNADSAMTIYGKKLHAVPGEQKKFTLDADLDLDMGDGDINIPQLVFTGLGMNLNSHLETSNINNHDGKIDGRMVLTGQNLAGVLGALDQDNLAEVLQNVRMDGGFSGTRTNINLSPLAVDAIFSGDSNPNSPVKLEAYAVSNLNLDEQMLTIDDLTVKGPGLNVHGKLNASDIMDVAEYSGRINIDSFNLQDLMRTLNMDAPQTADSKVLTRVAFISDIHGSNNHIRFENLNLELDASSLKGNVAITDFENPATTFDLVIDRINMDHYLSPGTDPGPAVGSATTSGRLPVEALREWNTSGTFNIDHLVVSDLSITDVNLGLNASNGMVTLAPFSAQLYSGQLNSDINLNVTGRIPRLTINASLPGIEIAPMLTDYTGKADLEGKGDISLALFALGDHTDSLKSSLSGQGSVAVGRGRMHGVDVRALLDQIEIMIETKNVNRNVDIGEFTDFENFDMTFTMNSGVATSENFLLKAPGFNVTGTGTLANLNTNTMQYDLNVSVEETRAVRDEEDFNLGGYNIPIRCKGSLDNIGEICRPEYLGIVSTIIQKTLVEKVFNDLGGGEAAGERSAPGETETDPARELLEGLFGR